MHKNLTTFLGLKYPVLNFLNFLSSRALLSYKPLSYKKTGYCAFSLTSFPTNPRKKQYLASIIDKTKSIQATYNPKQHSSVYAYTEFKLLMA